MTLLELSEILGNLGEFMGSFLILTTLIYLAIQVKHSKELLDENRKIALGQVHQARADYRLQTFSNHMRPEVLAVVEKLSGPERFQGPLSKDSWSSLSIKERYLFRQTQRAELVFLENNHYQESLGLLAGGATSRTDRQLLSLMPSLRVTGEDRGVSSELKERYEALKGN
jgi:hypothetical protein